MSKDYFPILAILFTLALVVGSFAFYRSFTTAPLPPKIVAKAVISPLPSASPTQVLAASTSAKPAILLEIDSPQAEASVSSSLLTVSGKTATGAAVIINDETEIPTDTLGAFRTAIRLTEGPNLIVIEASHAAGSAVWQTVVTYLAPNKADAP